MKQGKGCFALMVGLGVLGLIAFGLASLSRTSNDLVLSSLSPEPGGSLALYQLLKAEGIPVERAMSEPEDASKFGLSISFDWDYNVSVAISGKGSIPKSIPVQIRMSIQSDLKPKRMLQSTPMESDFAALPSKLTLETPETVHFQNDRRAEPLFYRVGTSAPVITGRPSDESYFVMIPTGQAFLNRYISSGDNAQLIVSLVKAFLPEGKKVLIPEYLYTSAQEDTLFSRLGPAFTSFVIQLLVIFVFVIYSLGKRFGYPPIDVPRKPGSADFVAALGEAFRRGKSSDIVLQTEFKGAMRLIVRRLNLPADVSDSDVFRRLPMQLGLRLMDVRDNQAKKLSQKDMSQLLDEMHVQLKEFLK